MVTSCWRMRALGLPSWITLRYPVCKAVTLKNIWPDVSDIHEKPSSCLHMSRPSLSSSLHIYHFQTPPHTILFWRGIFRCTTEWRGDGTFALWVIKSTIFYVMNNSKRPRNDEQNSLVWDQHIRFVHALSPLMNVSPSSRNNWPIKFGNQWFSWYFESFLWISCYFCSAVVNPILVYFAPKPPRLKPLQQQRDGLVTWKILWVSCQDPQLFKLDGLQPVSYDREYTPWLSFLLGLLVLDLCVVVVLSERRWSYLRHSLVTPRWQMLSPRCFVRMRLLEWIKITASPSAVTSAGPYRLPWHFLFSTLGSGSMSALW